MGLRLAQQPNKHEVQLLLESHLLTVIPKQ
jgi:hypothetical protein